MYIELLKNRLNSRLNDTVESDRADSISVGQIIWITIVVVIALMAGAIMYNRIQYKSRNVGDQVTNTDTDSVIQGTVSGGSTSDGTK